MQPIARAQQPETTTEEVMRTSTDSTTQRASIADKLRGVDRAGSPQSEQSRATTPRSFDGDVGVQRLGCVRGAPCSSPSR